MKKVIFLFMCVLTTKLLFAQYADCPTRPVLDTLYTSATRVTRDFYYNSENTATAQFGQVFIGPVDLNFGTGMQSTGAGGDTITIEVYGIKRQIIPGQTTWGNDYIDSHRVAIVTVDSVWYSYPIDPLWSDFPLFDGLRFVYKSGGTDDDSTDVMSNIRIWPQGGSKR